MPAADPAAYPVSPSRLDGRGRGGRLLAAMKRTLLILLAILSGVAVLVVIGALLLAPLFRYERGAEVHAPAVLSIELEGRVVERAPPDLLAAQFEGAEHELLDLSLALDRAAEDDRIAGVYLRVGEPGYGWAMAEELKTGLAKVRAAGKFVYAFTALTNELGYYVALEADSVFVLPGSGLEMNGFRVETPFVQGLLEKVGIEPQVEAIGVYKSAADMFRRTNMSDPDREATQAILDGIYGRFVDGVIQRRGVDRGRLVAALDEGVYVARDLQTLGLIDGELHAADVQRRAVARALAVDPDSLWTAEVSEHVVDVRAYASDLPEPGETAGTIGLVYAVGAITGGESGYDPVFGRTMGAGSMTRLLGDVADDEALDAVVIRIDSPGGDALASEEIWGAVESLRELVPVVVSMGDVAASGGYYMAAGADRIVAAPSTLTGSIGVFGVLFNARGLYSSLGIDWDTVKTNPSADFPTSIRSLTDAERETFRRLVEHTYRGFLGRVSEGREMTVAEVDSVAQGRVWSGAAASELGLVDRVGGLDDALALAKEEAGLDPDAHVRLHVYPRPQRLIDRLRDALYLQGIGTRATSPAVAVSSRERVAVAVLGELVTGATGLGVALREGPGRVVAALPWVPTVH